MRILEAWFTVGRAPLVARPSSSLRRLTNVSGKIGHYANTLLPTLPLMPEDRNWFIAAKRRAGENQDERACNSKQLVEAQAVFHDLPHTQVRLRLNECLRSLSEQASRQRPELKSKPLQIFISYAHPFENVDSFERWTQTFIFRLRDDLHTAGLHVILDDMHSVPGRNPIDFMTHCVKSSDVLLMVGTETLGYKGTHQKADRHEYFVRYELMEIWQRHQPACQQANTPLLPILISGNTETVFNWMFKEKKYHPTVYEFNAGAFLGFNNVYIGQLKRLIDAIYKHAGIPLKTFDSHWELMNQVLIHSVILKATADTSSTNAMKPSALGVFQAPPVNHYFVPRKDLMIEIEQKLASSDDIPLPCRLIVLSGMGGTGKTHLVRYYFQAYSDFYKFSGYFNAASLEDLLNQYRVLAEKLGLFETSWRPLQDKSVVIASVVDWLTEAGHTLLVYDNVQCVLADLELFLPKTGKHTVLVTTRRSDWPNLVNVSTMSLTECQQLMSNIAGRDENSEQINELSQAMGCLPLAMSQACAYIKVHHLSIQDYLSLYEKNKQKLLVSNTMPAGLAHDHYPVWITFQVMFQTILHNHPNIIYLLKSISLLNPAHIPKDLLTEWAIKTPIAIYSRKKSDIMTNIEAAKNYIEFIKFYSLMGVFVFTPMCITARSWSEVLPLLGPHCLLALLSAYHLARALAIHINLRINAVNKFYSTEDEMYSSINNRLTREIDILSQSHLIDYNANSDFLIIHPLIAEFLFELTIINFVNVKNAEEKHFIGVLQKLLHEKYLLIKSITDDNKNYLITIAINYQRLHTYISNLDLESYYEHASVSETKRAQCQHAFIFYIDFFEMHLIMEKLIDAEECLLEAMNILTIASRDPKQEERLDFENMYIALNYALDKLNQKMTGQNNKQVVCHIKKFTCDRVWMMLRTAVNKNQTKIVKWLYDLGAPFTRRDILGRTLLLQAAAHGHVEILELLLSLGSSLLETDREGNNALLLASKHGWTDMIVFLHRLGLPLSVKNDAGETPLIIATESMAYGVRRLLELGASLNDRDNKGYTALLRAAANLNREAINCLLSYGANWHEVTEPRSWEKPRNMLDIVRMKHGRIRMRVNPDNSPEVWALLSSMHSEFENWLSDWQIIEAIKTGDLPALQFHCFNSFTINDCLSFFSFSRKAKMIPEVGKNTGVNIEDFNGDTPLFYAAKRGHEPIFRFLLLKGADYKHRNQAGDSVLHTVIREGQVHLLAVLWEKEDYDVDMQNNENFTPLMLAAMQAQVGTVELLLKRGANTELRNNFGQRAIDLTEDAMIREILGAPTFRMANSPR